MEPDKELERLRQKIAYYEEAIPMGKGNCYHRFTDEGICVRCGEDAEAWDAGCVEEIVEDLQSVTTREFARALRSILYDPTPGAYFHIVLPYLEKIEKFAKQWELIESWKERSGVDARIDIPDTYGSSDFVLDL